MDFRTILVPIEEHDSIKATLETALLLARKFDGYIEGFALRVAIPAAVSWSPRNRIEPDRALSTIVPSAFALSSEGIGRDVRALSSARALLRHNPLITQSAVPPRSTVRRETSIIICSIDLGLCFCRDMAAQTTLRIYVGHRHRLMTVSGCVPLCGGYSHFQVLQTPKGYPDRCRPLARTRQEKDSAGR
jgi:hypothetical protein